MTLLRDKKNPKTQTPKIKQRTVLMKNTSQIKRETLILKVSPKRMARLALNRNLSVQKETTGKGLETIKLSLLKH